MMHEWQTQKAKDLVSIKTGKLDSNASVEGGKYPFFTCAQATYKIDKYAFDTECVLLAGNNAAGIFPLKYFRGKFNAYQRTYVIEPIDDRILDVRFLYFSLKPFLKNFERSATGATTKFLTLKILHALDIPVPPLSQQKKIAAMLAAYDDLIENNTRRIALLEQMAEELYREWFVRMRFPGHEKAKFEKGVPNRWKTKKFEAFCTLKRGYDLPESKVVEGKFPVIAATSIKTYHHEYKVKKPVVTTGRSGSLGTVLYQNSDAWPLNTALYVKDFHGNSPRLVFFTLKSMKLENFNAGAGVPSLNRNHLHNFPIVVPPKPLQKKFDDVILPIFDQADGLKAISDSLCKSRDRLLSRLISGKLSVEDLDIHFPPSMAELDQPIIEQKVA